MNHNTTSAYEEFILRIAGKLEVYSTFVTTTGAIIGGILLGRWGYEAGGIGGAILFTIAGSIFGGGIGIQLPSSIVAVLGTVKRLIILVSLFVMSVLISYIFSSIPLGLLLFIATWLYLYYWGRQPLSL
jgi:hypothetical protein